MKQLKAKITENKKVAAGFYKIRVESAYLAKNTKPGQFFEVKCSDSNKTLLRRPLGAHRILKNGIEMLYEVVGRGTQALSGMKAGGELDIIGPLGKGFEPFPGKKHAILVAGGIGVAPLLALAEKMSIKRPGAHVIIGARNKAGLLCEKEFKKLGCFVMVSTEDGSKGHKGYATDILNHLLKITGCRSSGIYACGPHPMLKAVARIARLMNVTCQVSMEEKMACGVGVCLGCPVKVKAGGYKMVCKDGPVFDGREIAW